MTPDYFDTCDRCGCDLEDGACPACVEVRRDELEETARTVAEEEIGGE